MLKMKQEIARSVFFLGAIAVVLAMALFIFANSIVAKAAPLSVPNGIQFTDTDGNFINAHGGGIIQVGNYFYWYGEHREDSTGGWLFEGISCYRTTNFKEWEYRGDVLNQSSAVELEHCNIERPKVVYNTATKKFVMYAHWENGNHYGEAKYCVAYCDTPDGDFTYKGSFRPLEDSVFSPHDGKPGYMSRDCTLFIDDDGTGYFLSAANENADMHIYKLSSDYLQIISLEKVLWAGQKREAPCLFKRNGYYILLTSAATGWNPNQAKYGYTTSITGTWSNLINIGNSTTYDSQPAYISTITGTYGTSYLYMGDRWAGAWQGKVNDSRYVWAPLKFNSDTSMSMNYFDCISVDTQTGDIDSSNDIVTINDSVTGSSNHQFDYNGTWSSSSQKGAHDNNNHWSSNPNSYYEIDFYGTKAKVYAAMASNHGIAAISIDGGPEISVDYFRAIRNECTLVYSSPILSLGLHTLKVRVTGNKNASSTAGAIPADRVDIYR